MARLGGKFAGILLVEVPDPHADALAAALADLEELGLQVTLERTDSPAVGAVQTLNLELLGDDRPGIVAEISAALAGQRVGILELTTDVREAPMSGGQLFEARATLEAPTGASVEDLRGLLEGIADELMVEISLSDG